MSPAAHHGAAVGGARRPARTAPLAAEPGHRRAETLLRPLLPVLTPWLATRRWYQGTTMTALRPAGITVIGGEGRPDLLVAVVETGSGTAYQLLLGMRSELPRRLEPAAIGTVPYGPWAGQRLYDAVADPALMGALLRALAGRRAGPLRLDPAGRHPLPVGLVPRPLAVDQSNSAVVYGDRLLLKLYRRPEPGPHPEVEALRALTDQDCPRTPRLHGSLHLDGLTLGLVEEFLPGAEDGWQRAVAHARDHLTTAADPDPGPGPAVGFAADAQALGRAVAETHGALARAFPRTRLSAEDIAADAARMKRRLTAAVAEVPQLARHRSRLAALFDEYGRLGARGCPVLAQRTHGDLHLGQALYTGGDWHLVDFEGEPATPAAERALPQPVLRDVAGMLRSFDYAARAALLPAGPHHEPADPGTGPGRRLSRLRRAGAWAQRNRRAFCAGYADGGGEDPACRAAQLTAFEADRAVYEAVYEARHRPHWLPVPLAAVHRLAGGRAR